MTSEETANRHLPSDKRTLATHDTPGRSTVPVLTGREPVTTV